MTKTSDKKTLVYNIFEKIAPKYDLMNDVITFGKNRSVKKNMINNVPIPKDARILDVCTGTGDIAIGIAKLPNKPKKVTGLDFSQNMLDIAIEKSKNIDNIEFIKGDALELPFDDNTFDAVFIGYGLRNLEDLNKGISELKRVTKKGGYVVNFDLGKPKGIVNLLFRPYFFNIVPAIGQMLFGEYAPYKYLPESSKSFPSQEELVELFYELGFEEVKNHNFMFGAISQQIAKV